MRKLFLLAAVGFLFVAAAWLIDAYFRSDDIKSVADLEAAYLTEDDRFVAIDGARVRVREQGPSDGDPVILLHGFAYSLESWDAWAADLAQSHRVIRYDLLGHGLTGPDPKQRYAPQERAVFIGDVMDALEIDRAIIVGNSLGGLAAWRFAAIAPERAEALILLAPAAFPYNGVGDDPAPVPAMMRVYLNSAPEAAVRASTELVYGDDEKVTDARVTTLRDMMRRDGNGAAMLQSLEEFTLPDPTQDLLRVTAPTQLIWGSEDAIVPLSTGERMNAIMPRAMLKTLDGVGHAPQEEAPQRTLSVAREFLTAVAAAPAAGQSTQ
ncbi:MAG: alpha/beta fold hydrolase [Pseudomonadota bacterium]